MVGEWSAGMVKPENRHGHGDHLEFTWFYDCAQHFNSFIYNLEKTSRIKATASMVSWQRR